MGLRMPEPITHQGPSNFWFGREVPEQGVGFAEALAYLLRARAWTGCFRQGHGRKRTLHHS
jgi:hypothetical protein